jgi:hypothetical protein
MRKLSCDREVSTRKLNIDAMRFEMQSFICWKFTLKHFKSTTQLNDLIGILVRFILEIKS